MPDRSDPVGELERQIDRLRRDLERTKRERARLEHERDRLERERDRLRRENDRLKRELDLARRAGKRQAAPFSKGPPTAAPRRRGRRRGARHGRHGHRPPPARVDEVIPVPVPTACPHCTGPVTPTRVAAQYQEELPVVHPIVRRFAVGIGCCTVCGRRVQGRHPLQTSDALGAAAVQLGPQAVALMVVLNKQLGLSHGKVTQLLRQRFGLAVTTSTVTRALHRAARQAQPTYAALCATIRGSPVVAPDETSWKVDGHGQWLWAFATPETTVYAIQPGRGFGAAAAILGADYAGVLVRDGWAPYRRFTDAAHQTCLAHLLRRARDLARDHPRAPFAARVTITLQQALGIRARRVAGVISPHGAAVARGHVLTHLFTALDHVGSVPDMQRFAAHLSTELPALFSFLFDPAVDATNWRAEHALRPAVVNRKVCGGNRSARGAHTQQVLTSVLRTAQQRQLDASEVLVDLLRAPQPTVSQTLAPPPEPSPRADAGGSNGYRSRLWKATLQAFATATGLDTTVCHCPPGTSKWNKIEHRLFSHITMNWRGRPLVSHDIVVKLIGSTTTKTGLRIKARLDRRKYPLGIHISDTKMDAIKLTRHTFHGDWNYSIAP